VLSVALLSLHHSRTQINSARTTCCAACEERLWLDLFLHPAPAWQGKGTISQELISHRGDASHNEAQTELGAAPSCSETTELVHMANWSQICSY